MWNLRKGEINPVKKFYIRRFFRIAPLFWIMMFIYLQIYGYEKNYWRPDGIGALQIFLTATFLHGFDPNSMNSIVPGGWSISVEMIFYVLFPILIIYIKKNHIYLILTFIVWGFNVFIFKDFALDFLVNNYNTSNEYIIDAYLYFQFFNQAPIFLFGCYIYFILNTQPKKIEVIFLVIWFLFVTVLGFLYNIKVFKFTTVWLIFGAFIYICIKADVSSKIIEKLGKNSYSIYLVHFLVLYYLEKIIPFKQDLWVLLTAFILTTLLSYFLALIIFFYIESNIKKFVEKIIK